MTKCQLMRALGVVENNEIRCCGVTTTQRKVIRQLQECYSRFRERIFNAIPGSKRKEVLSSLEVLVNAAEDTRQTCCPIREG